MIAFTSKKPRWPEPAGNDGRWVYFELWLDGGEHRLGGYVNLIADRGKSYADWLTHELLVEITALFRQVRRARTLKDYDTSMAMALARAAEAEAERRGYKLLRPRERPVGREHYRKRA
jgi:hypothetical protein